MDKNSMQERFSLAKSLLLHLQSLQNQLASMSSRISKGSDSFYQAALQEDRHIVEDELEKYRHNLDEIRKLNLETTEAINKWYSFIKDNNELKHILFPMRFKLNKRKLKALIRRNNEAVSAITIENRFIKENLANMEHELELKAIQRLKEANEYLEFEQLLKTKDQLVSDLSYLLPTLPDICPVEVDMEGIDSLAAKLTRS